MEEDLLQEKKEKDFVREDLDRAYQHIDHLRRTSPPKGELQRLNGENEMLRDSIKQQDLTVSALSGELGERNREIEFLRERLSAIERDNKDIAERVALDHERKLREK